MGSPTEERRESVSDPILMGMLPPSYSKSEEVNNTGKVSWNQIMVIIWETKVICLMFP